MTTAPRALNPIAGDPFVADIHRKSFHAETSDALLETAKRSTKRWKGAFVAVTIFAIVATVATVLGTTLSGSESGSQGASTKAVARPLSMQPGELSLAKKVHLDSSASTMASSTGSGTSQSAQYVQEALYLNETYAEWRPTFSSSLGLCMAAMSNASYGLQIDSTCSGEEWLQEYLPSQGWTLYSTLCVASLEGAGFIAYRDSAVVVSIRGTVVSWENLENLKEDLNTSMTQANGFPGTVHTGFLELYNGLKSQIVDGLQAVIPSYAGNPVSVYFTGHSLGAAVAVLAAYDLTHNEEWYDNAQPLVMTYGGPRIGNDEFAVAVEEALPQTWLVENQGDEIPHVPLSVMGFEHMDRIVSIGPKNGDLTFPRANANDLDNSLHCFSTEITYCYHSISQAYMPVLATLSGSGCGAVTLGYDSVMDNLECAVGMCGPLYAFRCNVDDLCANAF